MKLEWGNWSQNTMTWDEAVKYADSFKKDNWRLPTIKELKKIMLDEGYDDLGKNIFFDYNSDIPHIREIGVWSSTESKSKWDEGNIYCIDPMDIETEARPKDEKYRVILCRGLS
jgi:hypothetical protein